MNKHEIRTVKQEAERFAKGITLIEEKDALKLELPYSSYEGVPLYFYILKRKGDKKFTLAIPVESTGVVKFETTLAILQPVLRTYGLIITQDAIIIEETSIPLNQRLKNMAQAMIGIDSMRRFCKADSERRGTNATESTDIESTSN